MNPHTRLLAAILAPLIVLAMGHVNAKGVDAATAEKCAAVEKCPYFYDVYDGTPKFRGAIKAMLASARIAQPGWVKNGTSTPMVPVTLEGKTYLFGWVCEPHNCPHKLIVLYSPATGSAVGVYDNGHGKTTMLGDISPKQRQVLSEYLHSPSMTERLDDPKTLPVVIH